MHCHSVTYDEQNNDKAKYDPKSIITSLIPDVVDEEFHDFEQTVPVLSRTTVGLSVMQLFTLMIGSIPADYICCKKPTAVKYSSIFVVDLACVRCIDDLHADDNGSWVHGGKPSKDYNVEFDGKGLEIVSVTPIDSGGQSTSQVSNHFTLVRLYHRLQNSNLIDSTGKTVQYVIMQ